MKYVFSKSNIYLTGMSMPDRGNRNHLLCHWLYDTKTGNSIVMSIFISGWYTHTLAQQGLFMPNDAIFLAITTKY